MKNLSPVNLSSTKPHVSSTARFRNAKWNPTVIHVNDTPTEPVPEPTEPEIEAAAKVAALKTRYE